MGRFSNLEFTEVQKTHESQHYLDKNKDEHFYLEQAHDFYYQGKFETALRLYSRTLEINPSVFAGWFGQVRMLLELQEFKEADLWSEKALGKFPEHNCLIAARAIAQAYMANIPKAMAFSDASLKTPEESEYPWFSRGIVLLAAKQTNYDHCFWKAKMQTPCEQKWFLHLSTARVYKRYQKITLALKELQKSLALKTDSAFVWYEFAHCKLLLGSYKTALASFQRVLELDPEHPLAAQKIVECQQSGWEGKIWGFIRSFRK